MTYSAFLGKCRGRDVPLHFLYFTSLQASRIIATMPKRRPPLSTPDQTTIDFTAPEPDPVEETSKDTVEEATPAYSVTTGWIDTAGKKRTWRLHEPSGTKLCEITTKSGAEKIAALLNQVEDSKRQR
jgi:hypothetical protein